MKEEEQPTEQYQLLVRFLASNTPLIMFEGSHIGCLDQAKNLIKFIKTEHLVNGTNVTFSEKMHGTDKIMLLATKDIVRSRSIVKTGLYATFDIRRKIDKSEYDNPLEASLNIDKGHPEGGIIS